ncbi:hypothetical protein [Sedimentimonas flavescens]|uniref:hypothetical protein n=1 Tax=Sedimentimonas flavescens TaxID=2851012 RepID=UPI001C4A64EC|nr:hypothetical protein [Sedimentimonas flavescens]MBW0159630.1 hypothetical protein [Sedimentimonas flavescens]
MQTLIAVLLILGDMVGRWHPAGASDLPKLAGPVEPGDQLRRFEPSPQMPRLGDPSIPTNVDLPEDFPERLTFQVIDGGKLGELLLLNGAIETGDTQRLQSYLADLQEVPKTIALNSPGGMVVEALALGRLLRELEIDTTILDGMACMSSCPYVSLEGLSGKYRSEAMLAFTSTTTIKTSTFRPTLRLKRYSAGRGRRCPISSRWALILAS